MQTIKTRFMIISDTHACAYKKSAFHDTLSFRPPFPKVDVLLHTGDFTMAGTLDEHRQALDLIKQIPATLKLVIAGNHELTLDKEYYVLKKANVLQREKTWHVDNAQKAEDMWTSPEAHEANIRYLTEGTHHFDLSNGASLTVYASAWTPEFYNWAFNYDRHEDRWNPPEMITGYSITNPDQKITSPKRPGNYLPTDKSIDIVMTHGPPFFHLDRTHEGLRVGCPQLLQALERVRPKIHCFGHIHESWGAERVIWEGDKQQDKLKPLDIEQADGEIGLLGETGKMLGKITGGENIVHPSDPQVVEQRGVMIDISNSAEKFKPLENGKETLLINSAIMTLRYRPDYAPWIVDLDLTHSKSIVE